MFTEIYCAERYRTTSKVRSETFIEIFEVTGVGSPCNSSKTMLRRFWRVFKALHSPRTLSSHATLAVQTLDESCGTLKRRRTRKSVKTVNFKREEGQEESSVQLQVKNQEEAFKESNKGMRPLRDRLRVDGIRWLGHGRMGWIIKEAVKQSKMSDQGRI